MMTELTHIELYFADLPAPLDGLRIVHVSDMHIRRWTREMEDLLEVANDGCDLLAISGDSCSEFCIGNPLARYTGAGSDIKIGLSWRGLSCPSKVNEALEVLGRLFEQLPEQTQVVVSQGNHDFREYVERFDFPNAELLINTSRAYEFRGVMVNLAGHGGGQRYEADFALTLEHLDPELFTIAVCHYPEMSVPLVGAGIELILSGHTHGGQVCLPNGKPLETHSRTGLDYYKGLTVIGHSIQYTTRGLGVSMLPFRLNCPPEIVRYTLRRGEPRPAAIHVTPLPD